MYRHVQNIYLLGAVKILDFDVCWNKDGSIRFVKQKHHAFHSGFLRSHRIDQRIRFGQILVQPKCQVAQVESGIS